MINRLTFFIYTGPHCHSIAQAMLEAIQQIIDQFELTPHPEGGFYREVYRSEQSIDSPLNGESRAAVTHIYFMLVRGQVSRFHKVLHDEIWNVYAGAPLQLIDMDFPDVNQVFIGPGKSDFMHVIKGGHYQAAQTTGEYTLVGCTVAPGFDFADFSFVEDQEVIDHIHDHTPYLSKFL